MENSEKIISLCQDENYLLSIDWLQLYLQGEMTSTTFFKYRDKKRNTRVFRYWYEVIYCDEVVFDVFFCPFSSVIKKAGRCGTINPVACIGNSHSITIRQVIPTLSDRNTLSKQTIEDKKNEEKNICFNNR